MTTDITIVGDGDWLDQNVKGALLMVASCLFAAFSATATYKSQLMEPHYSALVASFVRVLANPVWTLGAGCLINWRTPLQQRINTKTQSAGKRKLLFAWGISGAVTVTSFFLSLKMIGAGPASFLMSTSGIITALCAPYIFGAPKSQIVRIAAVLAFAGCLLLRNPFGANANYVGWSIGIISGFAGGIAYLILSMLRGSVPTSTIMAYWTGCCVPFHLIIFLFFPPVVPHLLTTWFFVFSGGLAMAGAQFFIALSFAKGDPMLLGILTYLAPLFTIFFDMMFFGRKYSSYECIGAFLIILGGSIVILEKKILKGRLLHRTY